MRKSAKLFSTDLPPSIYRRIFVNMNFFFLYLKIYLFNLEQNIEDKRSTFSKTGNYYKLWCLLFCNCIAINHYKSIQRALFARTTFGYIGP